MKNAEPVFCMKNMTVEEITPLSSDRHVRLSLIKDGKRFSAIWFGIGAGGLGFVEGNTVDAAFLEINEFRGRRSVQRTICDVQLSDCEHLADQKILNLYNTLMQDGPSPQGKRVCSPARPQGSGRCLAACDLPRGGRTAFRTGRGAFPAGLRGKADATLTSASCLSVWTFFRSPASSATISKEGMLNILLKPYEGARPIFPDRLSLPHCKAWRG